MIKCTNCGGTGEVGESDDGANWYAAPCPVCARAIEAEATKPQVNNSVWAGGEHLGAMLEQAKPLITSGGAIPEWTDEDKERLGVALEQMKQMRVTKPKEPITVTCQIYGHVVGVCDECNTHAEKDVHDTNKILADNYLKMTCGEPQPCPHCNNADEQTRKVIDAWQKAETRCVELEKEAKIYQEDFVSAGTECIKQAERIKELEAELLNREGMTCGDCNDTGWLENREEGRYPCTCMTEAEPYQLLEAERDDWKSRYESNLSVNQMHSDNNAEMLKFNAKLLAERDALELRIRLAEGNVARHRETYGIIVAERDALAMQNQQMRSYLVNAGVLGYKGAIDAALALPLPDTSEIIKRHDAAVLRKYAAMIPSDKAREAFLLFAAELEKS